MGISSKLSNTNIEAKNILTSLDTTIRQSIINDFTTTACVSDVIKCNKKQYFMPPINIKSNYIYNINELCSSQIRYNIPNKKYNLKQNDIELYNNNSLYILNYKDAKLIKSLPPWFKVNNEYSPIGLKQYQNTLPPNVIRILMKPILQLFSSISVTLSFNNNNNKFRKGILLCTSLQFYWNNDGNSPTPEGEIVIPPLINNTNNKIDIKEVNNNIIYKNKLIKNNDIINNIRKSRINIILSLSQTVRDNIILTYDENNKKRRKIEYIIGKNTLCDINVNILSGFCVPYKWTFIIKDRINKTNTLDDIYWKSIDNKIFRSSKRAKDYAKDYINI